ncbi:hypothetical protein LTR20_000916 [Exophiala xenobiotica]|nr:hypothetical protein LTR40_008786 [Exophiala xenobiotica]KAK5374626.1 hypothetical protein LTS13_005194 [Exophiala xenobiotica]KAK5396776.1 hypothetical protein LTR79_005412 [Exophiala xenobiotica]KAK5410813.1 hypothetical protein LTR90_008396 [Exophiala xenobiotica]KAK5470655.1 hypothetical protein LTR20_000916 [Exophiala xenobiotica]
MVDTLHPPLSVIATWPKPNYINPETRGPALELVCIIFAAIGIVIVTARIYSRLFITKAPGWDDLLVVIALLFLITLSVLVIISNKVYHTGRHVWDIPADTFVGNRLNIWICLWCYIVAISLIKVSVLLFYRRLSVKFSKAFLIATWIGIAYNILYFVAFGLTLLLLCDPLNSYWESFDPVWAATHKSHCANESVALPISAGLSVLGDFYSTLLPLILVYHLDLPARQKIALYLLFALGFMAVAAGIVRTVLLYDLLNVNYDFSWELWATWIWALLELYLALFAASAPGLKPFFRRFFVDSIGNLSKSSRRRMDYHEQAGNKGTLNSETSKTPMSMDVAVDDVERIGVAYGGDDMKPRERGFLHDIEQDDTRHFELRASRDGKKMIPMQVYKRSTSTGGSETPINPFSDHARARTLSNSTPRTDNWPMPPVAGDAGLTALPNADIHTATQHQRPVYIGLRVQQPAYDYDDRPPTRSGSVKAARLRAQANIYPPPSKRGSIINPPQFEDQHDGLGSGSQLESPSDTDEERSIYQYEEERPPWNTIVTSSSRSARTGETEDQSSSDETLQLPRMGSRDFHPGAARFGHGEETRVGYAS